MGETDHRYCGGEGALSYGKARKRKIGMHRECTMRTLPQSHWLGMVFMNFCSQQDSMTAVLEVEVSAGIELLGCCPTP